CGSPSNGQPSGGGYHVTLVSGGSSTTNDFGNYTTGSVSGVKREDHNANGTQDAGDQGLSGWTIRAYNAGGTVADSTSTANDGTYTLNLSPGTYTICDVSQNSFPPRRSSGLCGSPSTGQPTGGGYHVTPASGGSSTANDFGNYTTG